MAKKEAIVKYITEMNTDMLSLILDDNISYMHLTKDAFVRKLNEVFLNCKLKKVTEFSEVCKGKCIGECNNKGITGYNFSSDTIGNLALLFEEENKEIIDICNCSKFGVDEKIEAKPSIGINAYEDEKINFTPSFEEIILMNKTTTLYEQFNQFKGQITLVKDIYPLINECRNTYKELDFDYRIKFKFVDELFNLFHLNSFVLDIVELNDLATIAMEEFYKLDVLDERLLVKWLLEYDDICFLSDFKKLDDWDSNHFLVPTKFETIVIDCTNFVAALQLNEIHSKYKVEVMLRYQPTEEHYKMAGKQYIIHSLPSLLTWHIKYLDLLPPDVQIAHEGFKFPTLND